MGIYLGELICKYYVSIVLYFSLFYVSFFDDYLFMFYIVYFIFKIKGF